VRRKYAEKDRRRKTDALIRDLLKEVFVKSCVIFIHPEKDRRRKTDALIRDLLKEVFVKSCVIFIHPAPANNFRLLCRRPTWRSFSRSSRSMRQRLHSCLTGSFGFLHSRCAILALPALRLAGDTRLLLDMEIIVSRLSFFFGGHRPETTKRGTIGARTWLQA
jgi:hypothetical protein